MAVTIVDIITVLIAYVICFIVAEQTRRYVETYCQDNPEIIWIWLDDDDGPQGGHRVKNEREERQGGLKLSPVPSI